MVQRLPRFAHPIRRCGETGNADAQTAERLQRLPHPDAIISRIIVGRVVHPFGAARGKPVAERGAALAKQRTKPCCALPFANRRHAGKAIDTGAAAEAHQHRLRLIIHRMAKGDGGKAFLARPSGQQTAPRRTGGALDVSAPVPSGPAQDIRLPPQFGGGGDDARRLRRAFRTKAMVHRCDEKGKIPRRRPVMRKKHQRDAVAAARYRDAQGAARMDGVERSIERLAERVLGHWPQAQPARRASASARSITFAAFG